MKYDTKLFPVEPAEPLTVKATEYDRQYRIDGRSEGQTFDDRYVNFSGYFGNYGPHVFAAAPDLLEALIECVHLIERHTFKDCDKARRAIAKAEGSADQ